MACNIPGARSHWCGRGVCNTYFTDTDQILKIRTYLRHTWLDERTYTEQGGDDLLGERSRNLQTHSSRQVQEGNHERVLKEKARGGGLGGS